MSNNDPHLSDSQLVTSTGTRGPNCWVALKTNAQQRKRGVVARRWNPVTGRTQEQRACFWFPWRFWRDCRRSYTRKPKQPQARYSEHGVGIV